MIRRPPYNPSRKGNIPARSGVNRWIGLMTGAVAVVLIGTAASCRYVEDQKKMTEEANRTAQVEAEAARLAQAEAERKAAEEAARLAQVEAERKAAEEPAKLAQAEAERTAAEEAARLTQAEAERKAAEESAKLAQAETKPKAAKESAKLAQAETKPKAAKESAKLAQAEAERKAAEEVARLDELVALRKANVDEFLSATIGATSRSNSAAESKAAEEAARLAQAEAERKAAEEAARLDREVTVRSAEKKVRVDIAPSEMLGASPAEVASGLPWPPPRASATVVLPTHLFPVSGRNTLGVYDELLTKVLWASGYSEYSYHLIPKGFAIVTRVERIYPDGSPYESARWATMVNEDAAGGLLRRLKELLFVEPGYFRVLLFAFTPESFVQARESATVEQVSEWLPSGRTILPPAITSQPAPENLRVTVLVYEFEQLEKDELAYLLKPGRMTAMNHLERGGIWQSLASTQ